MEQVTNMDHLKQFIMKGFEVQDDEDHREEEEMIPGFD